MQADRLSRWKHDHTDIRPEPKIFEMIDRRYGPLSGPLRNSGQPVARSLCVVSWRPDLSAVAADAFVLPLEGENLYCFPPVSCIPRLLRDVLCQQVTVTLIAPD